MFCQRLFSVTAGILAMVPGFDLSFCDSPPPLQRTTASPLGPRLAQSACSLGKAVLTALRR